MYHSLFSIRNDTRFVNYLSVEIKLFYINMIIVIIYYKIITIAPKI